jgi:hypothetical protein
MISCAKKLYSFIVPLQFCIWANGFHTQWWKNNPKTANLYSVVPGSSLGQQISDTQWWKNNQKSANIYSGVPGSSNTSNYIKLLPIIIRAIIQYTKNWKQFFLISPVHYLGRNTGYFFVYKNHCTLMDMDMQYGHRHVTQTEWTWTCSLETDTQHGHGHGHAGWTSTRWMSKFKPMLQLYVHAVRPCPRPCPYCMPSTRCVSFRLPILAKFRRNKFIFRHFVSAKYFFPGQP